MIGSGGGYSKNERVKVSSCSDSHQDGEEWGGIEIDLRDAKRTLLLKVDRGSPSTFMSKEAESFGW